LLRTLLSYYNDSRCAAKDAGVEKTPRRVAA